MLVQQKPRESHTGVGACKVIWDLNKHNTNVRMINSHAPARYPYIIYYDHCYCCCYYCLLFVVGVLWWKSIKTGRTKNIKQNPLVKTRTPLVPRRWRRESWQCTIMSLTAVCVVGHRRHRQRATSLSSNTRSHIAYGRTKHSAERPYLFFFNILGNVHTILYRVEPNRSCV